MCLLLCSAVSDARPDLRFCGGLPTGIGEWRDVSRFLWRGVIGDCGVRVFLRDVVRDARPDWWRVAGIGRR